jgi:hypothetical protein
VTRVDLDAVEARAKAAATEGYGGEWCWDGGTLVDEDHDEAVGISRDHAAPTSVGAHIAGMDPPTTLALAAELRAARAAVEALDEIRRLYLALTAKGQHSFYVTRSYDVAMRGLADYRKAVGP